MIFTIEDSVQNPRCQTKRNVVSAFDSCIYQVLDTAGIISDPVLRTIPQSTAPTVKMRCPWNNVHTKLISESHALHALLLGWNPILMFNTCLQGARES